MPRRGGIRSPACGRGPASRPPGSCPGAKGDRAAAGAQRSTGPRPSPAGGRPESNAWTAQSNAWTLESNAWTAQSNAWTLESNVWTAQSNVWTLESNAWTPLSDFWRSQSNAWTAASVFWRGQSNAWTPVSAFWRSQSNAWTAASFFWTPASDGWTSTGKIGGRLSLFTDLFPRKRTARPRIARRHPSLALPAQGPDSAPAFPRKSLPGADFSRPRNDARSGPDGPTFRGGTARAVADESARRSARPRKPRQDEHFPAERFRRAAPPNGPPGGGPPRTLRAAR